MKDILKISGALILLILVFNLEIKEREKYYINSEDDYYDLEFSLQKCTQYHPIESECNEDPFHTANMTRINLELIKSQEQKLCAFSNDVIKEYELLFNDIFDIWTQEGEFLGRWKYCDRMNSRVTETVDLMIHPDEKAIKYTNVIIRRIKKERS